MICGDPLMLRTIMMVLINFSSLLCIIRYICLHIILPVIFIKKPEMLNHRDA